MKIKTSVDMPKFVAKIGDIKNVCVIGLRRQTSNFIAVYNQHTLKNTGKLRNSVRAVNIAGGFSIRYGVPYADEAFRNYAIHNVTTPGTTSFWDDAAKIDPQYGLVVNNVANTVAGLINASYFIRGMKPEKIKAQSVESIRNILGD